MARSDSPHEHQLVHQHFPAESLLLEVRAEIKQGFDQLSVSLVGEIKDLLTSDRTLPGSVDSSFPAASAAHEVVALSSKQSRDGFAVPPPALPEARDQDLDEKGRGFGSVTFSSEKSSDASVVSAYREDDDDFLDIQDETTPQSRFVNRRVSTNTNFDQWRETVQRHVTVKQSNQGIPLGLAHMLEDIKHRNAQQSANQEHCVYRLVDSKAFTALSVFLIVGNAMWMGFECTVAMNDLRFAGDGADDSWHDVVNMSFAVWFMLELLLKLIAFRQDFFFGPDQLWNALDVFLVLLSIPDFFSSLMNVSFVRTLRLARLTRGLRLMRLVKFLSSLREILMTVFYTMGSLFWSFVAILLVAYIVALLFMQSINNALQSGDHSANDDTTADFMTVGGTMLVLFSTISGGQDWYDLVKHFYHIGAYGAVYGLISWVYFMLFGLVNIVVAVFCAKAAEASHASNDLKLQKAKEDHQRKLTDLARIFRQIDTAGRGFIVEDQFRHFANGIDAQLMLRPHGLQLFALDELWGKMTGYAAAAGIDGEVDLAAFVMSFMRFSGESVSTDLMLLESKIKMMRKETREQYQELHEYIAECCQERRDLFMQSPRQETRDRTMQRQQSPRVLGQRKPERGSSEDHLPEKKVWL